ncbi:hypothetical protein [Saccharopolyspora sp. SCSIO 74807]|uniref:hypothetical protein n=1 Tax=Saccharopolyspora sp. SCSIO 74807 TaxID=3118084 RepID=UPI0030CEB391
MRANMAGDGNATSLPKALDDGAKEWAGVEKEFHELRAQIESAINKAEGAHEGKAADAAKASIGEITPHLDAAAETAKGVQKALTHQAEIQNKTFHQIPGEGDTLPNGREVQLDPPEKGWVENGGWDKTWYLGWASDYEERQEDFQATNDRAADAQRQYQNDTQSNLAGTPEFKPMEQPAPPPQSAPGSGMPSANDAMAGTSMSSGPSMGGGEPAGNSSSWASGPSGGGVLPGGAAPGAAAPPAGSGSAWAPGALPPGVMRGPDGTLYRQNPQTGAWERQNPYNGRWAPAPGGGPGGQGAGGARGGAGGGAGARAGGGAGGGVGAGGRSGVGGVGGSPAAGGAGAQGAAAGARGGAGAPGGMGGAQRGQQDDEQQHDRPTWLVEDEDVFTNDMRAVAPPVFGDWGNQD